MKNKDIQNKLALLLEDFKRQLPDELTEAHQNTAAYVLEDILLLLQQAKPQCKKISPVLFDWYIKNQHQIERELIENNYYSVCCEIRSIILFREPIFEKRLLYHLTNILKSGIKRNSVQA